MDPNTHSVEWPASLAALAAVVDQLAAEDLDALPDSEAARRVLVLHGLIERLEGVWLRDLAGVDGRGAAGTDHGTPVESTAGWLRHRTRMGHPDAHQRVRVARALHRGPLARTARALAAGELSYPHAAALTRATQHLPSQTVAAAEPVLLDAARRLDHPGSASWSGTWARSPTRMLPTSRPYGGASVVGCGWRRPSRGWPPSMGCWMPRRVRPC